MFPREGHIEIVSAMPGSRPVKRFFARSKLRSEILLGVLSLAVFI